MGVQSHSTQMFLWMKNSQSVIKQEVIKHAWICPTHSRPPESSNRQRWLLLHIFLGANYTPEPSEHDTSPYGLGACTYSARQRLPTSAQSGRLLPHERFYGEYDRQNPSKRRTRENITDVIVSSGFKGRETDKTYTISDVTSRISVETCGYFKCFHRCSVKQISLLRYRLKRILSVFEIIAK